VTNILKIMDNSPNTVLFSIKLSKEHWTPDTLSWRRAIYKLVGLEIYTITFLMDIPLKISGNETHSISSVAQENSY